MRETSPAPSPIEPQDDERPRRRTKPDPFKRLGAIVGAAVLVVVGGGSYVLSAWSPAAEAHVSRKHDDRSADEKLDQLVTDLTSVKADIATAKTDIAVIKRQLGLDGLGAPPPDRIPLRSSRFNP